MTADHLDALILYGSFAVAVSLTFSFSPDDAFITLRYASNLIHGHGPVYNPGQRVNGATSPVGLMMAVAALLLPTGYTYFKLKLISLAFGLLTVARSRRLVEAVGLQRWARRACFFAFSMGASVAISSGSGLETTVDSFAVVGILYELVSRRAFERPGRAMFLAALAVASRPEAPAIVVCLLAMALLSERHRPRLVRVLWALPALATELAIVASNRFYYGTWLPNTYYAKDVPLKAAIGPGIAYVKAVVDPQSMPYPGGRYMTLYEVDAVLLRLLLISTVVGLLFEMRHWRRSGYLLAAFAAQAAFAVRSGGDWMHGARFVEPVVIVYFLLQARGLEVIVGAVRKWIRSSAAIWASAITIALSTAYAYAVWMPINAATNLAGGVSDASLVRHAGYPFSPVWSQMPQLLSCAPPGSTVAVTEGGYGPYERLDLDILDIDGLTNSQIAHRAAPSTKQTTGVVDMNWWQPSSVTGQVLLATRPLLIQTVVAAAGPVLGGAYREVDVVKTATVTVHLYERDDVRCSVPT